MVQTLPENALVLIDVRFEVKTDWPLHVRFAPGSPHSLNYESEFNEEDRRYAIHMLQRPSIEVLNRHAF
jgi:hypothetical protein